MHGVGHAPGMLACTPPGCRPTHTNCAHGWKSHKSSMFSKLRNLDGVAKQVGHAAVVLRHGLDEASGTANQQIHKHNCTRILIAHGCGVRGKSAAKMSYKLLCRFSVASLLLSRGLLHRSTRCAHGPGLGRTGLSAERCEGFLSANTDIAQGQYITSRADESEINHSDNQLI